MTGIACIIRILTLCSTSLTPIHHRYIHTTSAAAIRPCDSDLLSTQRVVIGIPIDHRSLKYNIRNSTDSLCRSVLKATCAIPWVWAIECDVSSEGCSVGREG